MKNILFLKKLRTEPFLIGTHLGELYPVKNGYDKTKSFIYGTGYVKLNNQTTAEPLILESNPTKSILDYHKKYGIHVLRYALNLESVNDCRNTSPISQLNSFLIHSEGWIHFFEAVQEINEKMKLVVLDKWSVETVNDTYSKTLDGQHSCIKPYLLHVSCSLFGIPMEPHIDWVSYEKGLDLFIMNFTPKGDNFGSDCDVEYLENESVINKLEYVTNKEIIRMVNNLTNPIPDNQLELF